MGTKLTQAEKNMNSKHRSKMAALNKEGRKVDAKKIGHSIVQQLDVLCKRRQDWETTDYKKANEGLYGLLAECLEVFQERFMKADDEAKKALRTELKERLTADGIRVVSTSTTLTMLARFVFNSDRKRAQGYGYVLAAALSHDVKASDFTAWVSEQGGIEEIKRKMVSKPEAIAKKQAIEAATAIVKGNLELNTLQPLAHVSIEGLSGEYAVLLAKPNVNGGADVVGTLSEINDALISALILRMAKTEVETNAASKEMNQQIARETGMYSGIHEEERKVSNG